MTAFKNYHVTPQQAGLALGPVLRQLLPDTPWSKVHRLVENRHVEINGNLCTDAGRKLTVGDVIKLWEEPRNAPPREDQLKIRYVDEHIVVVEKPPGLTTTRHSEEREWSPRRRQVQPTLDELLLRVLSRRQAARTKGPGGRSVRQRLRAVHRLDRDTSGLMVFARTTKAEQRLVEMFSKHTVRRAYWAIVQGDISEQTIESRLVRDRGDGRRGSTKDEEAGKEAVTHVRPLERLGPYTLIECRLKTGRTHQIRIHLSEAGHPVCGEKVYNRPLFGAEVPDHSGAVRQALHAFELGFEHPITGEPLEFQMPMPADMQRLLERLRKAVASSP